MFIIDSSDECFINCNPIDINECQNNNGGCDHTCNNEAGSYNCVCQHGFNLDEDLHGCTGVVYSANYTIKFIFGLH